MRLTCKEIGERTDASDGAFDQWLISDPYLIRFWGDLPLGLYWVESGSDGWKIKGAFLFPHSFLGDFLAGVKQYDRFELLLQAISTCLKDRFLWVDRLIPHSYIQQMKDFRYRLTSVEVILEAEDLVQIKENHHYLEMSLVYGLGALKKGISQSEILKEMFDYLFSKVKHFSIRNLKLKILDQENRMIDCLDDRPVRIFFDQMLHWKAPPIRHSRVIGFGWEKIDAEWDMRYQESIYLIKRIHHELVQFRTITRDCWENLDRRHQLFYGDSSHFGWREIKVLNLPHREHDYFCLLLSEKKLVPDRLELVSSVMIEKNQPRLLQLDCRWLDFHW